MKYLLLFFTLGLLIQNSLAATTETQNYLLNPKFIILTMYMIKHPIPYNPRAIQYWVDYSRTSPNKDVPLKNARITVKVYYNGNPMGRLDITTDDLQHFSFDKFKDKNDVGLEILAVSGQGEYHSNCNGYVRPKHNAILISCSPPAS